MHFFLIYAVSLLWPRPSWGLFLGRRPIVGGRVSGTDQGAPECYGHLGVSFMGAECEGLGASQDVGQSSLLGFARGRPKVVENELVHLRG